MLSRAEVSDRSRLRRAKHELPLTRAEEHEMHRKMHLAWSHGETAKWNLKLAAFSRRAQDPMRKGANMASASDGLRQL